MPKVKTLPKIICIGDIKILKISMENNDKLNDLLCVFKRNIEHLVYWRRPFSCIVFNHIYEIKKDYKESGHLCYAIFYNGRIIGCINIGKLRMDEEKLSCRGINYWIDKNHVRKGIMYNCLKSFEKIFKDNALDYIMTTIQEKNIPSVNLVKKMGFEKPGVDEFFIDFLVDEETGDEVNVIVFRKILSKRARQKHPPPCVTQKEISMSKNESHIQDENPKVDALKI
ncbi:hypothetical protein FACS189468_3760 [Spirochaetia bacterium]|nr:hypothetical protein FACS189468_3760 [Spirochaetia bacterium]